MNQPMLREEMAVFEIPDREARLGWLQGRFDDAVVVQVAGELDMSTAPELHERLARAVESAAATTVVLDMSGVSFIDACSIGVIVGARTAALRRGLLLQVDGLYGIPARLFRLLGLEPTLVRRTGEDTAEGDTGGRYERAGTTAAGRRSDGGAHAAG